MKYRICAALLAAAMLITMTGCAEKTMENEILNYGYADYAEPAEGEEIAVLKTSMGDIWLRFFPEAAPKAVENFKTLSRNGYYDGVIFYRVIQDFMIQGGDPNGTGFGGESCWGEPFEDEFSTRARNFRGALSMANSGSNTNGSQFFIVQADTVSEDLISQMKELPQMFSEEVVKVYQKHGGTPWLDGRHTVFGFVFKGMDVVDAIAAVKVDSADKPRTDVVINAVEIIEYHK